jgi:hypothetical protein
VLVSLSEEMNLIRWLVTSRLWVAFAAAAWCIESFDRMDTWVRWTLVAQVFFLTWVAYLFLTDNAMRNQRTWVLISLTGACVTFQGFDTILIPLACGAIVLGYRTHWMPASWPLSRFSLRDIPILNNMIIAACWVLLCMVWPMYQNIESFNIHGLSLLSAFLWITALSMMEDLFAESTPDASLRLIGRKGLRATALLTTLLSIAITAYSAERQFSVWLSSVASFFLVLFLPGGKRTPVKSWLIDAMILLRFPF